MIAICLLLVLAQPDPGEYTRFMLRFGGQLRAAAKLEQDNPDEAIRLLTALLKDLEIQEWEVEAPTVRAVREAALYHRALIHLQQSHPQAAADDLTALLEDKKSGYSMRVAGLVGRLAFPADGSLGAALQFPPQAPLSRSDWTQALLLRAEAYDQLGQTDEELADLAEAGEIMHETMRGETVNFAETPAPSSRWSARMNTYPDRLVSGVSDPLIVVGAFVVMAPVFFLMGLRQRREAGGTWRRLLWVSVVLAALQAAPLLAAVLLLRWPPVSSVVWPQLLFVNFVVFGINLARHRSYLAAMKWSLARGAPPLLEDSVVLGRIAEIAGRMGIAPPVTRVVRSASALQTNNALVSGLVAPTMVLFDGILHRLTDEERDAIIAHELAHLANHTFWYWLVSGAVCSVAAVVAAVFYHTAVALALGLALMTGTWLILSRRLELDCDRRAARVIGHRKAASALWKIHADQPFRGLVEFLFGAVSSHPSRDERLVAVWRDAPRDSQPEAEWDARLLGRRHLAAWAAAGLWLAVIAACLLWGYRELESSWPALPLVLMSMIPFALFLLGIRKTVRSQIRLQGKRVARRWQLVLLVVFLTVSFIAAVGIGLIREYLGELGSGAIVLGLLSLLLFLALFRNREKRLNHQITIALHSGDFPKALALCERSPRDVAGSTVLRYNQALVRAVLGRRKEALGDLEQLSRDDPSLKMTWLLLASLYADEGEYTRALDMAVQLSRDLPGEPVGLQAECWLLRKVGRLEEAETRAGEVLKLDPHCGVAHLTLAAIALDRGDNAGAREQLARGERLVPGSMTAALVAAEIALATDDGAEAAVNRAVRAAKNNPLSFTDKQVANLVLRLEARRQVAAPAVSPIL
jgi:Zn-dependent protease with chaperone function/Flp pilus assembly protein TadD